MTSISKSRVWSRRWDPGSRLLSAKSYSTNRTGRASNPGPSISPIAKRFISWVGPRQDEDIPAGATVSRDRLASCSFPYANINPTASTTPIRAQYAPAFTEPLRSIPTTRARLIASSCQPVWRKEIHTTSRRLKGEMEEKYTRSTPNKRNEQKPSQSEHQPSSTPSNLSDKKSDASKDTQPAETHGYLHLPHLPHMPHRPTREELLAAATGFWSRLKVRFKWFSIRSTRPWNIDDWSAFASWFVLGNIVWVFVGTTTFFSLVIFSINTVFAQGNTGHLYLNYSS